MDVKRTGRIFGWFFIGTFVTSIPARLLFVHGLGASWSDVRFIPGAGSNTSLKLGRDPRVRLDRHATSQRRSSSTRS